jgi:hypothetical protein
MNNIKKEENNLIYISSVNSKNKVLKEEYNKAIVYQLSKKRILFNEPFIFKRKKSIIKPLRYINNDTGKMKHFIPGAQEWFNSIYSYNKNYVKLLPVANKNVMDLLKSYFNLFINNNILKTKGLANRYRKLSANKIFVGKGELKHTSEKVIITSYVYNAEQLYLKNMTRKLIKSLYYPNKELKKYVNIDNNGKEIITYNRPFTLKEYINIPNHYSWHKDYCFTLFWKEYVKLIGIKRLNDEEKKEKKIKSNDKQNFMDKKRRIFLETFSQPIYNENTSHNFFNSLLALIERNDNNKNELLKFELQMIKIKLFFDDFSKYIFIVKNSYLKFLKRYIYLLMINSIKFEKPFADKLLRMINNLYNKEIEFNIVNINKLHLNSDIYTQAVILKLKNRNNKLFKVLTSSLSKVKLPNVNRMNEKHNKSNKNEYLVNKIRNRSINSIIFNYNINNDYLNNLLLNLFSINTKDNKELSSMKQSVSLYKYIIRSLKHLKLAGIRLEAKGRLTRRFTASRSVFKVKWKGGLKNVDSSFKGLSTIMLRGDRKSNLQYSMLNSKNRNGAFGIKGWISSK